MRQIAFDSSNISSSTWSKESGGQTVCDIAFMNSGTYRFFGIPESTINEWEKEKMKPGGSAGKFFHAHIRGVFSSVKLQCQDCKKKLEGGLDSVIVSVGGNGLEMPKVRAYCRECYVKW